MQRVNSLLESNYSIHDISVTLSCNAQWVSDRIHNIFSYFGLALSDSPTSEQNVSLKFLVGEREIEVPTNALKVTQHCDLTVWQTEGKLYLSEGGYMACLSPSLGTGISFIQPSWRNKPDKLRTDLVMSSLLIALRCYEMYAMHAAALVQDGIGCLFVAESCSGKSTIALSLVCQGWGYLSDDSVFLRPKGENIEAMPLRNDLRLGPDAARYFPEIVDHWQASPLTGDEKRRLNIETLYPNQVVASCIPRTLIIPKIVSEQKSQLIRLSKAETLFHLSQQSALAFMGSHIVSGHIEVLKRLVNQTKSYRLLAGQDLGNNPALISHILSGIGFR